MIRMLPNSNSNLEEYYPFSDVDLVVSDIDGTLISGSEYVIKQIRSTIKSLKQQKVQLTVATGRTFFGAKSLLQSLDIKVGMPIALYNGGIVMEYGTENVLYSNFIDCFAVANILNNLPLNRTNAYIYTFYVDNDSMKENYEDLIIEKVYGIGKKNETYDVNGTIIEWIDSEKIIDLQVNAILVKKRGLDDNQIEKLLSYLKSINKISFTDSGNGFIEIKSKGSSKAIIYKFINEDKKCKFKKILAIGDNDNDKELFQSSDISVAVANSSSLAIDEADYVCKNENANGFLDMLNVLKTAKKYWIDQGE